MADRLTIGSISLLDHTKYEYVEQDEQININRQFNTVCTSCGTVTTTLLQSQLISVTRPYLIYSVGASADEAAGNRNVLLAELLAARSASLSCGCSDCAGAPKYLIRNADDQSVPDVWTIMDFTPKQVQQRMAGKQARKFALAVDLICFPGQRLPQGLS